MKVHLVFFVLGVIVLIGSIILSGVVRAADIQAPDVIQIKSIQVVKNVLEDGDRLFAFHYRLEYSDTDDIPDESAQDTFIFRLVSVDGVTDLGVVTPYPYFTNSNGYQQGFSGIYISADDALAWGSAYRLRVIGNPVYFDDPIPTTRILTSADYTTTDNQTENQEALGDYVIEVAKKLEIVHNIELEGEAEGVTVLTSDGEAYFAQAVPGLRSMCPQIFLIQASAPDYTSREWGDEQSANYSTRLEGSNFIGRINTFGTFLGIDGSMVFGGFFLMLAIGALIYSQMRWQTSTPGLLAATIIVILGVMLGGIPMALAAIVGLLAALFIGYLFFFKAA